MSHPLADVIRKADGFLLIGDSSEQRFPAMSYHSYSKVGKRFYCLDLGGLKESRGPTKGGKVYASVEELPEDRDDLAVIWVKPRSATRAVEVAHEAGCKRVWFSYKSGHRDAVARARELEMEVVEVGRCPVYYMDAKAPGCRAHTLMVRATRLYRRPPALEADPKRREIL
ncbi:MAG: CoA-binding protein [Deltaproteobacteria bacterium]|nr:CoA-binding protein [Deltaproteobacteria bacterium]MBW2256869.1 CoA-binding protein [Deltaproteobacteria bacterium]